MRSTWFITLLLVCLAYGQATAPPTQSAPPTQPGQTAPAEGAASGQGGNASAATPSPTPVEVSPTDPVITLKGLCQDPSKEANSCQTVVTKEQFEKLANALQPNMAPPVRRQLATAYSRMLAMSMAAEKKGLEKEPQYDQMLGFARMQILSQMLSRDLQEESQKVSDADIEKYYNDNKSAFEEANFQRIFVPKTKQVPTAKPAGAKPGVKPAPKPSVKPTVKPTAFEEPQAEEQKPGATDAEQKPAANAAAGKKALSPEEQQKANEEAMKKVAERLQKRAAAGEDFEKLQKEAYSAAGMAGTAPPVKMEKVRRTSLPTTQSSAFDLKPGEVSQVISDPSGSYIYKLVSKQTLPLDAVKNEIKNTISSQRFRDGMQAVQQQATPELNENYFGAARPPIPGMPPMPPPKGAKQQPPSEPDRD